MTEPRLRVTCVENFVKFGHAIFEMRVERHTTDRQTDTLTAISLSGKVIIMTSLLLYYNGFVFETMFD